MAVVTVHRNLADSTLVVWFGDPRSSTHADHTDSDVIVMLDKDGRPLGIEVLDYSGDDGPLEVHGETGDTRSGKRFLSRINVWWPRKPGWEKH